MDGPASIRPRARAGIRVKFKLAAGPASKSESPAHSRLRRRRAAGVGLGRACGGPSHPVPPWRPALGDGGYSADRLVNGRRRDGGGLTGMGYGPPIGGSRP